jgi:hypothetical protein
MANVVSDPRVRPQAVIPDFTKADPLLTFKLDDVALTYGSSGSSDISSASAMILSVAGSGTSVTGYGVRILFSPTLTGGCPSMARQYAATHRATM